MSGCTHCGTICACSKLSACLMLMKVQLGPQSDFYYVLKNLMWVQYVLFAAQETKSSDHHRNVRFHHFSNPPSLPTAYGHLCP